jgi:preprotein translocase subunit SecG
MFWTNTAIDILLFFYVIDCLFMGLVIMMQRSKQEGLGAAFGGGFTESVWGAQTSNVLVKATVVCTIIFFVLSISLARLYSNRANMMDQGSAVQQQLMQSVAPATPVLPGTPTNSSGHPVVPTSTPLTLTPTAPASEPATTVTPIAPVSPAKPASK